MQERGYDTGFHEILGHSPLPAPPKLEFFVETSDFIRFWVGFQVKSTRFHADFVWISARFHEIHMKSGFHECELLGDHQV